MGNTEYIKGKIKELIMELNQVDMEKLKNEYLDHIQQKID